MGIACQGARLLRQQEGFFVCAPFNPLFFPPRVLEYALTFISLLEQLVFGLHSEP